MYSTLIRGTDKKKTTLNWWEYWIGHCWMTGWQTIRSAFIIWSHLMTSNYEGYGLLKDDDPEQECMEWFWATLGEDDTYPKQFIEDLMQMCDDIETGKVKTYSMDEVMERVKNGLGWEDEDSESTET